MKLLTFEDGIVRIDGEELPGILSDLRVSGQVRFDEQSVDKASGKKKTPQGWEDADISLSLYLLTDEAGTCYDKLAVLEGFFKKTDGKANPSIFTVANSHLLARGIRRVVFSRLDSAENTRTDEIRASLSFMEHDAVRQNSPGECVITSGTSDCMRCKKIATAGQVPAFFVSPVVVWGMAGLACAGA